MSVTMPRLSVWGARRAGEPRPCMRGILFTNRAYLQTYLVGTVRWPELLPFVDKYRDLILSRQVNEDQHIHFAISGHIAKFQCNGRKVSVVSCNENGRYIGNVFRRIAAHKLDHHRLAIQVHSDKVAGTLCTITVAHHCICLVCTRSTVAQIVVTLGSPGQRRRSKHPGHHQNYHRNPEGKKPVVLRLDFVWTRRPWRRGRARLLTGRAFCHARWLTTLRNHRCRLMWAGCTISRT